jgi:DNA-directed RNA polymerase subunit RPC12/RpoP
MAGKQVPERKPDETTQAKGVVACPYCGSIETELFSLFGQQLLTVQYYCNRCRTPFEYIKDDAVLHDYAARKEGPL